MSIRVGQPRIKGNTTYYRLVTDDDETPVRLHDDIAEIIDRLGPEECTVGKVEVRYINSRGEEKRADIQFDSDGTHRDVYKTWQYSQQSGREIPLWFFNVKYRGNKFRIKLDMPNQRMAIAVSCRDEDTSVFDEFMRSLEGKDDWSHRQPARAEKEPVAPMDDGVDGDYIGGYEEYEEARLDASEMANLVDDGYDQGPRGYDDGYGQRPGDGDAYGRDAYGNGYDDGYGDRYDDRYGRGYDRRQDYDDRRNGNGYDYEYDERGGYDEPYDDGYGRRDGYGPAYDEQGYDREYDDGYDQRQRYPQQQGGHPHEARPMLPAGQQDVQQQGGDSGRDPFGRYFALALTEVILTSISGLLLIILLNMETHLGISITSVIFCAILLVTPLLAVSALTRVLTAHKKIQVDYMQGIRGYEKARTRMIVVLVLMLIWVVVITYLTFLWYTHGLPPQLSVLYDLLDHKI